MDRMAKEGAHIKNAFVTTSLSSPSRASILTGMYSHSHKVVDNSAPLPEGLVFFPQYLQESGYKTAFFGNGTWEMTRELLSLDLIIGKDSKGRGNIIIPA